MSSLVHKAFKPADAWATILAERPTPLEPVSHWTGGVESTLMLMEPFQPERSSQKGDLQRIYNRLAGYRIFLSRPGSPRTETDFVVYALPGSRRESTNALSAFEDLGAKIVDTGDPRQRDRFLEQIRSTAARAGHQANLPTTGVH